MHAKFISCRKEVAGDTVGLSVGISRANRKVIAQIGVVMREFFRESVYVSGGGVKYLCGGKLMGFGNFGWGSG